MARDTAFSKTKIVNLPDRNTVYVDSMVKNKGFSYIECLAKEKFEIGEKLQRIHKFKKVSIVGLGGIGKTQLAVEFAYRYSPVYDFVCWVDAESKESLVRSYRDLLAAIDMEVPPETPAKKVIELVRAKLPGKVKSWLLIYDNVEVPEFLNNKVPQLGGHALITSRNRNWKSRLEMDVFQLAEAIEYMFEITEIKKTFGVYKDAENIVIELGRLPLALSQSSAYIYKEKITFAKYLEEFKKNAEGMLETELFSEEYYKQVVMTTWIITMRNLISRNQMVQAIMCRCAFLSSDAIFLRLFDDKHLDQEKTKNAITLLNEYSMLKKQSNVLMVHRLVQKVTRLKLNKVEMEKVVIGVLDLFCSGSNKNIYIFWNTSQKTIDNLNELSQHALLLIEYIDKLNLTDKKMLSLSCELRLRMASFFNRYYRIAEAEKILEDALKIAKKFNLNFINNRSFYKNLLNSYMAQGKFQKAIDNIPDDKLSFMDKAVLYQNMGRLDIAEKMYLQMINRDPYVRGMGDKYGGHRYNMALVRVNLGMLYFKQKQYDNANQYLLASLEIYQSIGDVKLDIAQTYRRLGIVNFASFKIQEAKKYFVLAKQIFEELGKQNQPAVTDCQMRLNQCNEIIQQQQFLFMHPTVQSNAKNNDVGEKIKDDSDSEDYDSDEALQKAIFMSLENK